MLADIGNGTMNIMYINNSRPVEKKCFTEKYGTHQCVLAVREQLLRRMGAVVDDLVIEQVIRKGKADIGGKISGCYESGCKRLYSRNFSETEGTRI